MNIDNQKCILPPFQSKITYLTCPRLPSKDRNPMTKFHFKTGVPYYAYHHNNRLTTSRLVNISNKLHNILKNFAKNELIKAAYKLDH